MSLPERSELPADVGAVLQRLESAGRLQLTIAERGVTHECFGSAMRWQKDDGRFLRRDSVGSTRFAGEVMLDLLDGIENERTSLQMVRKRPLPFPPEPAAAIGINATRWSLDRADHREGRRNLLLRTLDALGLGFDS